MEDGAVSTSLIPKASKTFGLLFPADVGTAIGDEHITLKRYGVCSIVRELMEVDERLRSRDGRGSGSGVCRILATRIF